jgi:hypothetical protein
MAARLLPRERVPSMATPRRAMGHSHGARFAQGAPGRLLGSQRSHVKAPPAGSACPPLVGGAPDMRASSRLRRHLHSWRRQVARAWLSDRGGGRCRPSVHEAGAGLKSRSGRAAIVGERRVGRAGGRCGSASRSKGDYSITAEGAGTDGAQPMRTRTVCLLWPGLPQRRARLRPRADLFTAALPQHPEAFQLSALLAKEGMGT